jgi:hypothetical protein
MSRMSSAWRRMAAGMARHAAWVLPGARSDWAAAMYSELDYIAEDRAALRWALGCVSASYAARLAALARSCGRAVVRPVLAMGTLLFIALALGHASDQTRPTAPAVARTPCDLPDIGAKSPNMPKQPRAEFPPASEAAGTVVNRSQSIDQSCQPAPQP